ncbi:hypothetical protein Q9K01_10940 [Qipengyuania sp. DY56-A-20]|jgi:hypothetical protein|uniref:Lipoprotein n=1 Tax=Qipengyuania benthica TaxID=3067651 RepID=A0ABT9HA51_9SPHN|nr:hypothetical protein [Qipengyuania sp. DY56-A-20]MDP4540143.1 hypothetical protein [Qipengyuania sp. DY56-A-20]
MGKAVGACALVVGVVLGGCEQKIWTRDEIADIADDSVDAGAPAYRTESLNSRIIALESELQTLESDVEFQSQMIEIQADHIDRLNEHADRSDARFSSLVDHYNKHTH